ncbi:MAG: cytochrome c [Terriglobales bacterium]
MKTLSPPFCLRGLMQLPGICAVILGSLAVASLALALQQDAAAQRHRDSVYAALSKAPVAARNRQNPFEGNIQDAAAGGKLFEQHCADCHGEKAGGTRHGPSLLREEVRQATPGTLFWTLTNGVVWRGMPVWSKLPEPERWQIVTFLQSLNSHASIPAKVP